MDVLIIYMHMANLFSVLKKTRIKKPSRLRFWLNTTMSSKGVKVKATKTPMKTKMVTSVRIPTRKTLPKLPWSKGKGIV